jgi:hypothetical protein
MDQDIPQDEYFEWEDIISYKPITPPRAIQKPHHPSVTHFDRHSDDALYDSDVDTSVRSEAESSSSLGGFSATDSLSTQTSISVGGNEECLFEEQEHPDFLPSYESAATFRTRQLLTPTNLAALGSSQPEQSPIIERAEDDTAVIPSPEKHVDYLSHDWSEEDIWSTWKYLKSTKQVYKNSERLVNASWRMWMKERHQLSETEPMAINWQKDKDTTWLYGPYQQNPESTEDSPDSSSECDASEAPVRPILKKATLSETLLRRSISSAALAREASVAAKEARDLTEHGAVRQASLPTPLSLDVEIGSALKQTKSAPTKRKSVRFCDEIEHSPAVSPTSTAASGVGSVFEVSDDDRDEDTSDLELSPKSSTTSAPSNNEISSLNLQDTDEDSSEINFSFGEFTLSPECESDASDEESSSDDYFDSKMMAPQDITRSVLEPVRENLVDSVMNEFWAIFNQEWESGVNQRDGGSRNSSDGSTTSTSSSAAQASTGNSQRKRQRMDSESTEDDESRDVKVRQQLKPRRESDDSMKFACPFRKHDNSTYNIYTHRVCALSSWQTIARVKEHIYRCHQTPAHCKRCWATFKSQQQLDAHITVASEDICEVQAGTPPAGITSTVERQLRSRKKAHPNQSEEDRWRDIYKILFPNSEVPSPYFEAVQEEGPSSPDARELSNYEDYIRRELPRLVRSNIESVVRRETQPLEASLIGSLVSIIQDCQDRVFRSYREAQGIEHERSTPARPSTTSPSDTLNRQDPHDFRDDLDFLDAAFQSPATSMTQAMPSFQQLDSVLRPEALGFSDSGYASEPFCYCTSACTCAKGTEEEVVKDDMAAATLTSNRPWTESMSHPNWQHVDRADDEADWWMNI